ncbi:MAG: AAA family ATPase [Acidimicrobiia bacterium]
MDPLTELRVLLASGIPLIAVETDEEQRLVDLVRDAAGAERLWTWSIADGLHRDGATPLYGTTDVGQVVGNLTALTGPWTAVLCDPGPLLADPVGVRRLKELTQRALPGQTVVLVGTRLAVPPELAASVHPFALPRPTVTELVGVVERAEMRIQRQGLQSTLDDTGRLRLARALSGLTLVEADREVMRLAVGDGVLATTDTETALDHKAELLDDGGILEVGLETRAGFATLGGLDHLKQWFAPRIAAGLDRAVDPPRGVLLAGVPGCGKSAVARAAAHEFAVPLVLLDPGRIYAKYLGESEQRLAEALDTIDAMAPTVLWIDEIEKGFSSGGEDGGVAERVLGTFLRWLQDRTAPVFTVATANDVTRLPPELTRKGRFDELFFVDLPDTVARVAILRSLFGARSVPVAEPELADLAARSDGFSGAELEAAVAASSYTGSVTVDAVAAELAATVPLSRSRAADVTRLRTWARGYARPA